MLLVTKVTTVLKIREVMESQENCKKARIVRKKSGNFKLMSQSFTIPDFDLMILLFADKLINDVCAEKKFVLASL